MIRFTVTCDGVSEVKYGVSDVKCSEYGAGMWSSLDRLLEDMAKNGWTVLGSKTYCPKHNRVKE